jgi:hypothetical protein
MIIMNTTNQRMIILSKCDEDSMLDKRRFSDAKKW